MPRDRGRRCAPRSRPSSPWKCCRGRAPSRPGAASVVHMELGEPGAPAPLLAREAAKRAIDQGRIGYTSALGIASLRERIARHYRDAYGLSLDPRRIAVTTGSSAGFILAFLACFDAGRSRRHRLPGLSGLSQHSRRARRRARRHRDRSRRPLDDHARGHLGGASREEAQGRPGDEPRQSDRRDDERRGDRRPSPTPAIVRPVVHLRRDLSWPDL